jgi:glycosyltransferase involved in cell wall biosynthesis
VNVVARNAGWFFEDLKRHFRAIPRSDLSVVATDQPLRDADAWVYLRTCEAASSPDPGRTVVQIHDMYDHGLYRPGGERACVARCAAIAATHPGQRRILAESGIVLDGKPFLARPIGALRAFTLRTTLPARFTVAWVGRPVTHHGRDIKRVDWFVDAVRAAGGDLEVVLLGERLEAAHDRLRQAGIGCRYLHRAQNAIDRYPQHYQGFDCVVISSSTEAGPLCLFEALATGVPVVSTPVGWAPELLRDGENGYLAASVDETAAAIRRIRAGREAWFARRAAIRGSMDGLTLESWIDANLDLALGLVVAR